MRISRFFVPISLSSNYTIELEDESAHYLRTVLRLNTGARIILFNGEGGEYQGTIAEVTKKRVQIIINEWIDRSVESLLKITLGLGIARGDRMDISVQKAVELGVHSITPLLTERCVVHFKGEKQPQRWLHWQKIIQHATEQSGRTRISGLGDIEILSNWLKYQQGLKIFLDPFAEASLADLSPINQQVTLLTGPEGGFSDQEREQAKAEKFIPVRLGARILRTETASLAAVSAVQMLWGDFGNRNQFE